MKKIIAVLLAVILVFSSGLSASAALFDKKEPVLRLIVPENWEMEIGDSRSVDCAADNTSNYVVWSAEPADIASVDDFGRVTALKEGQATITAQNTDGYTDSVTLNVVKEATSKEIVSYGKNNEKQIVLIDFDNKARTRTVHVQILY